MATQQINIPDIGDFDSVEVIEVLVAEGDVVAVDDSLVTLESDKATMEIPSPVSGKVTKVTVKVGDSVAEGDYILDIEADEASAEEAPKADAKKEEPAKEAPKELQRPPHRRKSQRHKKPKHQRLMCRLCRSRLMLSQWARLITRRHRCVLSRVSWAWT